MHNLSFSFFSWKGGKVTTYLKLRPTLKDQHINHAQLIDEPVPLELLPYLRP